jgi:hypothetical protein
MADWFSNPKFKQFASEALQDFGYGLSTSTNFGNAFGAATQRMAQMQPYRDQQQMLQEQQAEEQEEANVTMEWVKANYPQYANLPVQQAAELAFKMEAAKLSGAGAGDNLMSVGGHLYDTSNGQWISPPETAGNRQNISLSGQWGRDEQGNPVFLQPSSTGEMIPAQVPEGVTLMGPFDTSADRAAGSVFGKGTGGAQFDLPNAQLIADQTVAAINDVRNQRVGMDEHFGNVVGIPQQWTPAWPGSPKANFQVAADRAINRAFLEGREMLKGGGQITDFESRKAETAITAAQAALEKGDKAMFLKALDDFEQAVRDGLVKLQQQATTMPGYGAQQPPAQSGGYTILGVEQ